MHRAVSVLMLVVAMALICGAVSAADPVPDHENPAKAFGQHLHYSRRLTDALLEHKKRQQEEEEARR
jgi:hypothetical protein